MAPSEIKSALELANQDGALTAWWIYLIFFILTVAGTYIGAYLKIKAENFATKEDFNAIVNQMKIQVEATEKIKSEISFGHWKNQESNSIKRKKLEELVGTAFSVRKTANQDVERLGRDINSIEREFFDLEADAVLTMEMISSLYFPELKMDVLKVNINFRVLRQEIQSSNKLAKAIIERGDNGVQSPEDVEILNSLKGLGPNKLNGKIPGLYCELTKSIDELCRSSETMLASLMKV